MCVCTIKDHVAVDMFSTHDGINDDLIIFGICIMGKKGTKGVEQVGRGACVIEAGVEKGTGPCGLHEQVRLSWGEWIFGPICVVHDVCDLCGCVCAKDDVCVCE